MVGTGILPDRVDPVISVFLFPLRLDFADDIFYGHPFKQLLTFYRIVTGAVSELIQETNRIDNADLFNQGFCSPQIYIGHGLECFHILISNMRFNTEITLHPSFVIVRAFF
jgi:hypothetical protein